MVKPAFAKTSRKCPPFCIQPMTLAPGVETIGEVELIDYVRRLANGDTNILLIDSLRGGLTMAPVAGRYRAHQQAVEPQVFSAPMVRSSSNSATNQRHRAGGAQCAGSACSVSATLGNVRLFVSRSFVTRRW